MTTPGVPCRRHGVIHYFNSMVSLHSAEATVPRVTQFYAHQRGKKERAPSFKMRVNMASGSKFEDPTKIIGIVGNFTDLLMSL